MIAPLIILFMDDAFSAWLFTNSPILGLCLVVGWAALHVGMKYAKNEYRFIQIDHRFAQVDARFAQVDARFDRIESEIAGIKESQKAMGKRLRKVENRMGRIEGQLNVIIMMLKRNKTVPIEQPTKQLSI